MTHHNPFIKGLTFTALMLLGGVASAQVVIEGNVYGGGWQGKVLTGTGSSGGDAAVTINDGTVKGSVYGGGAGIETDETAGLVQGNSTVTMTGGTVERSIYGGGELGSVGTFTMDSTVTYTTGPNAGVTVPYPKSCATGTGLATVTMSGGFVGKEGSLMPWDNHDPNEDDRGWIFCGSRGLADSITYPRVVAMGVVNATHLEIDGSALITASVYGGCENGLVLDSTFVEIKGGQIGTGFRSKGLSGGFWVGTFDGVYAEEKWTAAIDAIKNGTIETALGSGGSLENYFHECDAWAYGDNHTPKQYNVYDIYYGESGYTPDNSALEGSNGHSFFGNVFGGGSGFYPIAPGVWRRTAGRVNGNTRIEVKGGHILTNIYGGNEVTDVMGKTTIKMTGGTLGVPRTLEQIAAHPVTCYLFGGGMGDPRTAFNTWTNVKNVEVEIGDDAFFFGSVFGGGQDGHVLNDVKMDIQGNAWIGTWGYSYVDGNVFGGGRGFSGEALTAGVVGGNVNLNITGGTMLGSIYGGGRMASVGTYFTGPNDTNYGQMQGGDNHGIVTLNITGGTIGNDYEAVTHTNFDTISIGGNVFVGAMGRLTKLDGSYNDLWPNLAKVKKTILNINGASAIIKGSVYGGGQFGTVTDSTSINILKGTIWRDVYGGGYGSDVASASSKGKLRKVNNNAVTLYDVYPSQWAGRVEGNTNITVADGWIKKSIYGGGELASVGTITDSIRHIASGTGVPGQSEVHPLYLSWPYQFNYANNTGRTNIRVKGGRIGMTGKDYMGPWDSDGKPIKANGDLYDLTKPADVEALDEACQDNGDIYGGSKGKAGSTYLMTHLGNVYQTVVSIKYANNTTTPKNYKPTTGDPGLENSDLNHVIGYYPTWDAWKTALGENAEHGCVTGAVYGGAEDGHVYDSTSITLHQGLVGHAIYGGGKGKGKYNGDYSLTAGKVYGNTHITMKDGYVVRSVFGGGNLASVGKGNYIDIENGEDTSDDEIIALANGCGHTYVNIYGGVLGMLPIKPSSGDPDPESVVKDLIPYGSVFGGARGRVVDGDSDDDDFFGYINHSHVTIGKTVGSSTNPRLYGSVYGGAQDGHVRYNTNVIVNAGEIGVEFIDKATALDSLGTHDSVSSYWITRGNIYGGGSGISQKNGKYSPIAGSVLDTTNVTINGGLIHRIVYGGGSLAKVEDKANVTVNSTIGKAAETNGYIFNDVKNNNYGGYVFGGGRGLLGVDTLAIVGSTEVTLTAGIVPVEVYGGGAYGQVSGNTKVNIDGGAVGVINYPDNTHVAHYTGGSVFGGGMGDKDHRDAALVMGNTEVNMNDGIVYYNVYGGGREASVGLRKAKGSGENLDFEPDVDANSAKTGKAKVTVTGGQVGPAPKKEGSYNIPIGVDGYDGYVFGGGKGYGDDEDGTYKGIADVNYTEVIINMTTPTDSVNNRIWGSVFGGSEDGHVLGDTKVQYISGYLGTQGTTSYDGNIFGGGRNFDRKNYTAGRVRGNVKVEMCGGHIFGNIYGGGRQALTGAGYMGFYKDGENKYTAMLEGDDHGNILVRVLGGTIGNPNKIETFIDFAMGDVFGGGKGNMNGINVDGHPKASALLLALSKNTEIFIGDSIDSGVVKSSPHILGSVFGGGEVANVGNYEWKMGTYSGTTETIGDIGVKDNGLAKVTVTGGIIGADRAQMRYDLVSNDLSDGNYNLKYNDDRGHVFGGGEGRVENPASYATINPSTGSAGIHNNKSLLDLMASVDTTSVTIGGTAWVKGSVYGGAYSGHVLGSTKVTVEGGQIGAGDNGTSDEDPYDEDDFINPLDYAADGDIHSGDSLYECFHWDYNPAKCIPFDAKLIKEGVASSAPEDNYKPSDGQTWFGNVFAGGSGFYPYFVRNHDDSADSAVWNRESGKVYGNTTVEITGGHILTSVYGGCEITDVGHFTYDPANGGTWVSGGKATVTMSGGTVGVPRTITQTQAHPVTCYLFGAGKGKPSIDFNTWTNVDSTNVQITGGIIYGSVFGGGEDGHVVGSTVVTIETGDGFTVGSTNYDCPVIGTSGRSKVDGNVFGGGRGFTGEALTAGGVGGNANLSISGGIMLGSIYGGGRLASVGTYLVPVTNTTNYGKMQSGNGHGKITINITGGTIGNDYETKYHTDFTQYPTGGNVFGGGKGRLENLDGSNNNQWHLMGRVKNTNLTISGTNTIVKGNVYGGGELGIVGGEANQTSENHNTEITISGGTLWRDVFGGGAGSINTTKLAQIDPSHTVTPMQMAARVIGNTSVTVEGGWIKKSVYGGGEMASVGRVTDSIKHVETGDSSINGNTIIAHPFLYSWPYEFQYAEKTGKSTVEITGGRVGLTGKDFLGPWNQSGVPYNPATGSPLTSAQIKAARVDNGDVFGGGKGIAGERYYEAHAANVDTTSVTINVTSSVVTPTTYKPEDWIYAFHPTMSEWETYGSLACIAGSVYGGAENGHVNTNATVTLTKGLVGHSIYGGGKGKDEYATMLYDPAHPGDPTYMYLDTIYSITSGKVYGNTTVTMEDGYVVRNIYGGGNLASIGKGNYAGGVNDYSAGGYGEKITDASHWDLVKTSGIATVNVEKGQVGYIEEFADGLSIDKKVKKTQNTIKDDVPYGSVFGGCRGEAVINLGRTAPSPRIYYYPEHYLGYANYTNVTIGETGETGPHLYGSVYGGGQDGHVRKSTKVEVKSGEIGVDFGGSEAQYVQVTDYLDLDSVYWSGRGNVYGGGSGVSLYEGKSPITGVDTTYYSTISGSVTDSTKVFIAGGTIHRNVYGGGNLGTVGPPRISQDHDCPADSTSTYVNIYSSVGQNTEVTNPESPFYNKLYGGYVYGASRGLPNKDNANNTFDYAAYSHCSYATVNIGKSDGSVTPTIYNAVFGGGENGQVGVNHASAQHNHNTVVNMNSGTVLHTIYGGGQGIYGEANYTNDTLSGRVMGNTTVNLMGGTVGENNGSYAANIFGGSRNANSWGDATVNVGNTSQQGDPEQGVTIYGSVYGANNHKGSPYGDVTVNVYSTAHTIANKYPTIPSGLSTASDTLNWLAGLDTGLDKFAIRAVYGGSNETDYIPKANKKATVHVYECNENSICDVYGGSNAAHVGSTSVKTDTYVIIDGGRIYRVFGGGNGEDRAADIHGTAYTDVNGGLINQVFGGSNNNGVIDEINLNINYGGSCLLYINDVFSGGNAALVLGDVITTVECCDAIYGNFYGGTRLANIYGNVTVNIFGATFNNIFAGSMGQLADDTTIPATPAIPADIKRFPSSIPDPLPQPGDDNYDEELDRVYKYMQAQLVGGNDLRGKGGNVTLNIFGGTINEAAYGGSDINGNIEGQITVNVFNTGGTCDLDLFNLYGASRNTAYTPTLSAGTDSPVINIIHGSVKGCVYGGGEGSSATVTASPKVNMGYYTDLGVYGHEGDVIDKLFDTIHAHTDKPGHPWVAPTDYAAFVYGNIYGGGNDGQVEGNTTVNVYEGEVGQIAYVEKHVNHTAGVLDSISHVKYDGVNFGGSVFGGGMGSYTVGQEDYGRVWGNSTVNISGGHVQYSVYGGGEMASVGEHREIHVNPADPNSAVIDFEPVANGKATVNITGGQVGPRPVHIKKHNEPTVDSINVPIGLNGTDGYVFGGGKGKGDDEISSTYPYGAYYKFANVNNTLVTVNITSTDTVNNRLWGSVFGGAEDGHVLGNDTVRFVSGYLGTTGTTSYDGNIFGGGRNYAHKNYTAGRVGGNTTVEMTGGQLFGNIYGGGRLGVTGMSLIGIIPATGLGADHYQAVQEGTNHGLAKVMVKGGTIGNNKRIDPNDDDSDLVIETFSEHSMGSVYGGGMGSMEGVDVTGHPKASSLIFGMTKNSVVEISDTLNNNTHIYGIVFGGGEIANVGKFTWKQDGATISKIDVAEGLAKVTISGGTIGADKAKMRYDLANPADPTDWSSKYNDDLGYVYGGGEGWSDDPTNTTLYPSVNTADFGDLSLLDLMSSVYETEVNISGGWVKASVFGGAESGHVFGNTKVNISGGQIGAGHGLNSHDVLVDSLYNATQFINPVETEVVTSNSLYGTPHWDYASPYNPYDPAKIRNQAVYDAGTTTYGYIPSDGKSWFGNVFGGGSGWFPYVTGTTAGDFVSHWNPISGKVWGNTEVNITGGHILNNVYGGNESTDVGGKATVKISGGTVGVPRTAAQVALQPVTCYVFGGGCGDPRTDFDNITVVDSTNVRITGGIIYGSVFGGAEDGHILGDVRVTVKDSIINEVPTSPVIGSTGCSGADGNIFCGGRNFLGDNLKAGRVAGNITLNMSGGTLLGSIFGGGRMGITGIDANGNLITDDPTLHGNVTLNISGGTVGNENKILTWLATPGHTTMGDVFGSGKGDTKSSELGRVKNATVNISSSARVLGSVYGGGELANVGWVTTNSGTAFDSEKGGLAKVEISGGQVGIEQIGTAQASIVGGNVFGGGYGLAGGKDKLPFANVDTTYVNIKGSAYITGSVFGGADNGHVWRNTSIVMEGGTVGQKNTLAELTVDANEQPTTDHIYTGSVLAGGRGVTPEATSPAIVYNDTTGIVFGNATVSVTGGVVRHAVYGGGGLSHVGTFERNAAGAFTSFTKGKCTVTVAGDAHIGPTKADLDSLAEGDEAIINTFFNNLGGNAGWVFGAGCGLADHSDLTFCDSTLVTIGGTAQVTGAVFGGGENGHVVDSTHVVISGGTIGGIPLHGKGPVSGTGAFVGVDFTASKDELYEDVYGSGSRVFRGNVYGGGKGNDTIADPSDKLVYAPHAGQVYGKSKVEITGGTIYNRVYGGGLLSSVGTFTYASAPLDSITGVVTGTGLSKVIISGGTIGTDGNNNGDVFGGGRGLVGRHWEPTYTTGDQVVNLAYVGNTEVTIKSGADIKSNVFGGSANGHVQEDTHVVVEGGTIGSTYVENGVTKVHGGWHSNVYGGGGGQHQYQKTPSTTHFSITSGRVYGNTKVEIKGGEIKHNVYGGGAIASVGTYNIYATTLEGLFKPGTGDTEVTITGGTIGVDGNNNGMVYGSGRGQIAPIGDFMDSLSYAVNTVVNIGTEGFSDGPMVHGSVYGSGENGHVFKKATVNVYSGTIGCEYYENAHASFFANHGNVYGAGCGTDMYDSNGDNVPDSYNPRSGIVQGNTEVNIKGGHISHNVYGGGAMALVGYYDVSTGGTPAAPGMWGDDIVGVTPFTGKAVVNVSGGTIGTASTTGHVVPDNVEHGNVYGGSRGPDSGNGFTNMALVDTTYVFISGTASVLGNVFGGGAKSWVRTARVATISGGTIGTTGEPNASGIFNGYVFGGGQYAVDDTHPFTSLKTVNVRGGHIKGNVYGSSYMANEDAGAPKPWPTDNKNNYWSSFVNITSGTIDHNVYGAGYGGAVNGSVCVNIGLTAVEKAPTYVHQTDPAHEQVNVFDTVGFGTLGREKLIIGGDIFGGSYQYENIPSHFWEAYDIEGYSNVFIDGDGYNMAADTTGQTYMLLGKGIYGSSNFCESGRKGRKLLLRNYGTRTMTNNEMTDATRTLTTIQRGDIMLIDNANIHLSGDIDISNEYPGRNFGILQADKGLYLVNGTGIVLGTDGMQASIDSVYHIKSLYLKDNISETSYDQINGSDNSNWEMVGIRENDNKLYRIHSSGSPGYTELTRVQENVIIFNDDSRLRVRYKNDAGKVVYGELNGFFRMRADNFKTEGMESFAYARPKLTSIVNPLSDPEHPDPNDLYHYYPYQNQGDGGFLSYIADTNFFVDDRTVLNWTYEETSYGDGGTAYTFTKQYPYYNISRFSKNGDRADMEEYREWVLPKLDGHMWYVDGTRGWGRDEPHANGWGDYPDKPKKTLTGLDGSSNPVGLCNDPTFTEGGAIFSYAKDIIFVVGAINASLEQEFLNLSDTYPLKLFRYPGGHAMSNGETDDGGGTPASPNIGLGSGVTEGPGVNLGAMVLANKETGSFTLNNVIVDGMYADDYSASEVSQYNIPTSYYAGIAPKKLEVSEPLIVTGTNAKLTLKGSSTLGGTILQRGYNKTDASGTYDGKQNYYLNPDFKLTSVHNGAALFVDSTANVKVEGLVTITGNRQKNGDGDPIKSNVYLATFGTSLEISNALNNATRIGITNPIRNKEANYVDNTFSPIAVATRTDYEAVDASAAYNNDNFADDLDWFFVNGYDFANGDLRRAYYDPYVTATTPNPTNSNLNEKTLFFGWTWANVVRKQPAAGDLSGEVTDNFDYANINSAYDLAWLASVVNGLNGQTGVSLSGTEVLQKADIDLQQYVWVPVGTTTKKFSGTLDGRGHIIKNLDIAYTGKGDRKYEYSNFGLFGDVDNGTVNRTFVVSGYIRPVGNADIGGLAARMEGAKSVISNSEAAVEIRIPNETGSTPPQKATGGLVGRFLNGEIHSSMAMPTIVVENNYYTVGGLVGLTETGTPKLYNSFAYPKFTINSNTSNVTCGGLVGRNNVGTVKNGYVRLQTGSSNLIASTPNTTGNYGNVVHTNAGTVSNCYGFKNDKDASHKVYPLAVAEGTNWSNCHYFAPVSTSDTYGYMYMDNQLYDTIGGEWVKADTSMMVKLNEYVATAAPNGFGGEVDYARWYRPTIDGINGDLPVLLLSNFGLDGSGNPDKNKPGLGGFRSMATYGGGPALQYGGPDRDGDHLNTMLARMTTSDNVFVYGDVTDAAVAFGANQPAKIAIHEDVAILNPGALATSYSNNYVGVTFDNSSRHATDVYGNTLHRDWHMFSTPLQDAPLGMDYTVSGNNQNVDNTTYQWDPWDGTDELPTYGFTGDGYFPTQVPEGYSNTIDGFNYYMTKYIYPYDFYTWYEPRWQWINFKRNGPSHWHYDEEPGTNTHHHIDYQAYFGVGTDPDAPENVNESNLIPGKGYMMAIHDNTYMQSHGHLNAGDADGNVKIKLTNSTGQSLDGWTTWVPEEYGYYGNNFVGNPFHAYLDFDAFVINNSSFSSYYTYDADSAATNGKQCDYLIYPLGGSEGGYYAPRYLHPHQGFFLQTTDTKDITFSTSQITGREDAGISPFRNWRPAYPLVNLFAYDSEGKGDVVIIEFNRPENGGGKKAKALRSGNHLIYAHNGDTDYGAFFAVEGTERVPVRFLSFESEQKPYTLRWDTHNGFFHSLYLIDNLLGITYDMLANDSYTFVGSKEDYASRFVIVFNVTDVEEKEDFNNFAFFNGSGSLVVNGTGRLEVIDVTGRILYTEDLYNDQNHVNLSRYAKGVYTLRLWNSDKARTQKIVMY